MCANLPNIYLRIWQILYNDFPIFTCSVFSDYITSQPEVFGPYNCSTGVFASFFPGAAKVFARSSFFFDRSADIDFS